MKTLFYSVATHRRGNNINHQSLESVNTVRVRVRVGIVITKCDLLLHGYSRNFYFTKSTQ